jgi:hypothetical protein
VVAAHQNKIDVRRIRRILRELDAALGDTDFADRLKRMLRRLKGARRDG